MSLLQALAWIALLSLAVGTARVLGADFFTCPCGCGNPAHRHNQPRSTR